MRDAAKAGIEMGEAETKHFCPLLWSRGIRCPDCSGWIDCRELAQVFEHEAPLPHPAKDQPSRPGLRRD